MFPFLFPVSSFHFLISSFHFLIFLFQQFTLQYYGKAGMEVKNGSVICSFRTRPAFLILLPFPVHPQLPVLFSRLQLVSCPNPIIHEPDQIATSLATLYPHPLCASFIFVVNCGLVGFVLRVAVVDAQIVIIVVGFYTIILNLR